ncbi:MAG: alpha/beta hydrolase [Clostridia bacterium]|nr:alpha/beta hydrolase [Clostridia bacterium]
MRTIENIVYNNIGQTLDVHLPEGKAKAAFVYFHGGGLEAGSKDKNAPYHQFLTARGIAVVDVNYRMYPAAKCPDFIEDAADAVKWAADRMPLYAGTDRIFVGGSSAGGYLSMMLCFDKKYLAKRGMDANALSGYVHDAGQPTTHFNVLRERGVDSRRLIVDEFAPLYHIGAYANACAPMTFIVSDGDMENRLEQTQLALSTLKHFRFDESKISLTLMNGGHCAYVGKVDANGESVFGKLIYEFIEKTIS